MVSVVTYGRNDNYGYNLHKRTAFGFNCLAESLSEDDEILFVDYNTPAHLPTLPEFIWDTFTPKALKLIKVIRVGQELHERVKGDSPLAILENVSRNAAIVRSNPRNHWVLSTNPDVLLVLASRWKHLGELLASQKDSFYEMPRFDIPENVWSALRRDAPDQNIGWLRDWLVSHGAAIAETVPDYRFQKYLLFDAPGDFQLAPRHYFIELRGFDESMNKYLHSDSNLAKRMWLRNGQRTDHLLGDLWVLHQDHYLSGEWARNVGSIQHNDYERKVLRQETVEANDENWGMQSYDLPMFPLAQRTQAQTRRLPLGPLPTSNGNLVLTREPDWSFQPLYKICHYEPAVVALYLQGMLQLLPPEAQVAYVGENHEMAARIQEIWKEVAPGGKPVHITCDSGESSPPERAGVLLVDCFYRRSAEDEERVKMVEQELSDKVAKGWLSDTDAGAEISAFADMLDTESLVTQLVAYWEKTLAQFPMAPGDHIILLGCNTYIEPFARFQRAFAQFCRRMKAAPSRLQRLYADFKAFQLRLESRAQRNLALKALVALRVVKRRSFRKLLGHSSLMGLIYFRHTLRRRQYLLRQLNLRTLYVHHRLIFVRVEGDAP